MKYKFQLLVILLTTIGVLFSCKKDDAFESLQVYTNDFSEFTFNSVKMEGRIEVKGEANITEAGFCWNEVGNSTIKDSKMVVTDASGVLKNEVKVYDATIDSLLPNQTYYGRAYAIYNGYIVYGNEKIFKTSEDLTPFWSFGENYKVDNISILYDSTQNALVFNNSDKTADMGVIQFGGGLQENKTYEVVRFPTELSEGQAQVANLIIDAFYWNSAGGDNDKIYTEEVEGKILIKMNNLTLKNNLDSNLTNSLSALFMVTK